MKLPAPALLVAALLGGAAAGALTARLWTPSPDVEPDAAQPSAPEMSERAAQMVKELLRENRDLRERVETLEAKVAGIDRTPGEGYLTREDLEAFVASLDQPGPPAPTSKSAEFKALVADALVDVQREEAAARALERQEKAIAQLDTQVSKMTDWLGLDGVQRVRVREILEARTARDIELTQQWESGVDPEVLGQTKRTNAELFRDEMQGALTPEQWATYSERGK